MPDLNPQPLPPHGVRVRVFIPNDVAFDHALVRATIHGTSSEIAWSADPTRLFEAWMPAPCPASCPP